MPSIYSPFSCRYTDPRYFPLAVFDQSVIQAADKFTTENLWESSHPFAACLRESDLDTHVRNVFVCRPGFEVVVCTHFTTDDFAEFLAPSLPLPLFQPILLEVSK